VDFFSLFIFSLFCVVVVDAETALYNELWHACAGPLVTVPREGDRVFYFPQGHIEQVLLCFSCFVFAIFENSQQSFRVFLLYFFVGLVCFLDF
jgi:hypothetical protein